MNSNGNKIRLCLIAFRAYPLFNPSVKAIFGGAEVDLFLIATELAKDDNYDVSFIVGDYGQPAVEYIQNVTLIKSIDDQNNLFLQTPIIWKALNLANADIYFSECMSLGIVLYAFYCFRKNKTYIYRTASSGECDGEYFRKNICRAIPVKWSLKQAKRIITQNQKDANNLKNTIAVDAEVIRNAAVIPELNNKSNSTILWIGRSSPVKQPEHFIDLAKTMTDQHFTMICPKNLHDPHYDSLCHKAEKVLNLEFVPGVPYDQVETYLKKAKCFVNTSLSEGFPNVFVQACLYAIPILSLNANPDDFLNKYNCGLCANGDYEKFQKMAKQLLDPDLANRMGKNAREYVIKNHDISNIIPQYKAMFNSLY